MTEQEQMIAFRRSFGRNVEDQDKARSAAQQLLKAKEISAEPQNGIIYEMIQGTPHAILILLDQKSKLHKVAWDGTTIKYIGQEGNIHELLGVKPVKVTEDRQTSIEKKTQGGESLPHDRFSTTNSSKRSNKPVHLSQLYSDILNNKTENTGYNFIWQWLEKLLHHT